MSVRFLDDDNPSWEVVHLLLTRPDGTDLRKVLFSREERYHLHAEPGTSLFYEPVVQVWYRSSNDEHWVLLQEWQPRKWDLRI